MRKEIIIRYLVDTMKWSILKATKLYERASADLIDSWDHDLLLTYKARNKYYGN